MKNIFQNAEKYGLERLGGIWYAFTNDEYDVTAVWRDVMTGQLFYGDCRNNHGEVPFANYYPENLTEIHTYRELYVHLVLRADRDSVLSFSRLTEKISELLVAVYP